MNHLLPEGQSSPAQPSGLEWAENKLRSLTEQHFISSTDLEAFHRELETAHLSESELRIVMLQLAEILKTKEDADSISLSISLMRAARAKIPQLLAENDLHDSRDGFEFSKPDQDSVALRIDNEPLTNSSAGFLGADKETQESTNQTSTENQADQLQGSWLTLNDEMDSENPNDIAIPIKPDPRLTTIAKLQNGENLTEDERLQTSDTISISDIRKAWASQIGTKAMDIRTAVIDETSHLDSMVLEALDELKDLVNGLFRKVFEQLEKVWKTDQEEKVFQEFFNRNQENLSAIFSMDKRILDLEKNCKERQEEIKEMRLELDFLLETVEDFQAELERTHDLGENQYRELLRTGLLTQFKKYLAHREAMLELFEKIQSDFRALFRHFCNLKIHIPDPWGK